MKAKLVVFLSLIIAVQLLICPSIVNGGMAIPWPLVSTLPTTEISPTTAVLNGELTRLSEDVPCALVSFMYGVKPGEYTIETTPQLKCNNGTFTASISSLRPCTRYYVITKATRPENTMLTPTGNSAIYGAGFGLDIQNDAKLLFVVERCTVYGEEISFETLCPSTFTGNSGGGGAGTNQTGATPTGPTNMSNIVVQSATITTAKVSPGEKVDIAASVTNKGGSNGASKVTLYVNGQEAESKGITLSSGQSTTMHFSVSRNDPGNYAVRVNGIPAGSFTVDLFTNNDVLIYGIIALFTIGIIGILYLVVKRRTA